MPYLGNSPVAGDHVNNFKVLDDISSHTATFDGSSTDVVDTTNNTIRIPEHRFIQGQRVTYTNGSGGNIGGLTTGTAYFVIFDTASTFKLATSASNAANSTAINLSSVGTGSSHTLNAAFDGVNTKFKITYQGGEPARFNNATQLNIAINNVIQRPNLSATTFTEGFAIEDHHKIVFKVAPTSEDIFWGSIIANTLTTFDISDHKIDTFTGDGSTTEFTLSHTPANNESLMVTINGVLQHPSNASTARAYTLIASIIQFTAAPGVGDEIQVRHLGFAGATTADVSGFYGRTGNVVLTDQDDIIVNKISVGTGATIESNGQATFVGVVTFGSSSTTIDNNVVNVGTALTLGHTQGLQFHTQNLHSAGFEVNQINSSGIITASSLDVSGNAFIGGVLTYEDVTSIDSVGIITARDGIDCNADLDVDGHTNLDNVSIAGVTTFTGAIDANGDLDVDGHTNLDNVSVAGIITSAVNVHTPYVYMSGTAPGVAFNDTDHENDFTIGLQAGIWKLRDVDGGVDRYQVNSSGQHNLIGSVQINGGNVSIVKDLDVDGHTNLDNVSIAGVTTFVGNANIANDTGKLQIGASQDLQIYHDYSGGSENSHIYQTTSKHLLISAYTQFARVNSTWGVLNLGNSHNMLRATAGSDVKLYFNNGEKLATTNAGVSITGTTTSSGSITVTSGNITASDGGVLINGAGGAILYLNDSNDNPDYQVQNIGGAFAIKDGTNNTERLSITSTGKVGINTDNPSQMLTVRGTILKTRTDSGLGLIYLQNDGSQNGQIAINQNGGVTRTLLHSAGDSYFNGGKLLIGNTQDSSPYSWGLGLQVSGTSTNAGLSIRRDQSGSGGALLMFVKSGGALNGNTIVSDDDQIGGMYFNAADGTDVNNVAANIAAFVDGTPGSNDTPGRLEFKTTADGANSPTERLRITSDGQVRAGDESGSNRTSYRHQFSSTAGSGDVLSLQNPSNSDGQGIGLGFWARNTNNAAIEVGKIKAVADETQANSTQSGSLRFLTNKGASMGERMQINTAGNVRISGSTHSSQGSHAGNVPLQIVGGGNNLITMFLGNGDTSGNGVNDYSSNIRFNGAAVAWGDISYYPTGNSNGGAFRFTGNGSTVTSQGNRSLGCSGIFISGTSQAQHLDDYEEGTWTPGYYPMSSSIPVTHDLQAGSYVKIGRVVYWQFRIRVSNITGNRNQSLAISGFPHNVDSSQPQCAGNFYGETWDGEMPTTIFYIGNTNRGTLHYYADAMKYYATSMLDMNINSSYLVGAGFYFAA